MKKFFEYTSIIILLSFWGIILTNKEQTREAAREVTIIAQEKLGLDRPCSRPLEYSIGNLDSGFGLSPEELKQLAAAAADFWNEAEGKTLLRYNPASEFKINLVYDNRQEQSQAAVELEQNLKSLEEANAVLTKQYDSLSATYKKKIDAYNKNVAEYKEDLEKYNDEVAAWNDQGGAPEDEYDKLKKTKKALDEAYKKINQERLALEALAGQTNSVAKKENQLTANYNNTVSTYKNQYGDAEEFEKGVFSGQEIDIYQFKAASDLRLTLTHEFGHYLGLDHVENAKSIMYYLMGDQDVDAPTLTIEDTAALESICTLD